jgi:oligopeptide transport system substrate-binding protein
MFVTGGANNQTGWSNTKYDELVEAAAKETDAAKRLSLLKQAEEILIEEQPILPIAFYMSKELVRPYVKGHSLNALKVHPLHLIHIEREGTPAP